jgi:hypothetical protein
MEPVQATTYFTLYREKAHLFGAVYWYGGTAQIGNRVPMQVSGPVTCKTGRFEFDVWDVTP